MSINSNCAVNARRRVLMAGSAAAHVWAPLGAPAAMVHVNALVAGDPVAESGRANISLRNGAGEDPAGSVALYQDDTQTGGSSFCLYFMEDAALTFAQAQYGAEAIEADCILPEYGDSMIVTCGNGRDNLIAAQLHVTDGGELYVKTFQGEETAAFELRGEVDLHTPHHVVLRLERYGTNGRISVNRGGGELTAEPLFETTVAGTDPAAFDPAMELIGFDSGLVFTNPKACLAKLTWWHL